PRVRFESETSMSTPVPSALVPPTVLPKGRRWKKVRFPCSSATTGQLLVSPEERSEPVIVRNLSGIGVSLVLSQWMKPGSLVTLALANTPRQFGCQVPMRVVSVEETSDGSFILEGAFARELRNVEVQNLL